ncbi:MAG: hypothetical protein AAFU85_10805 [Planctomycetota bacterium]
MSDSPALRRLVFLALCIANQPATDAAPPSRATTGTKVISRLPNVPESTPFPKSPFVGDGEQPQYFRLPTVNEPTLPPPPVSHFLPPPPPEATANPTPKEVRVPRLPRGWQNRVDLKAITPDPPTRMHPRKQPRIAANPASAKQAKKEDFAFDAAKMPSRIDTSRTIPHPNTQDFSPTPIYSDSIHHDAAREAWAYDGRWDVPTQHPWVEWGRIFYGDGITPRGIDLFGQWNLVRPQLYVYGDYRTGIQAARNAGGRADNWANRLNLDVDLRITDTERFHTFIGPLDEGGQFTRWELVDGDLRYRNEMDLTPVTAFFEGDLGVMLGAAAERSAPFDFPVTFGLVPLLFQNGIWMEDAVSGIAVSLPARHSRLLNWSNYDATFFAAVDQVNSPAFAANNDAHALGTAWFIEAYGGYIETGYAYLNDRSDSSRSYHNVTFSFTRRYFDRISNSVRVIVNAGQDRPSATRTADGGLLLFESSWITASPLTVVPYMNLFYGWDRPQSVARAGVSGGILRNTGINFDTDGLNGFPTIDTTAADTAGGSIGIDLIGDGLDRQLLLELSYLTPHGDRAIALGDQYAIGARYQFPVSNATLLRFDAMHGWREGERDVYGTRMEYRWKF